MSIKMLHCTATIHLLKRCFIWLVQIYWKLRLIRTCVKLVGIRTCVDHLGTVNFRTTAKENGTLCKNPNFVRTLSLSDVDSVRARKILGMQMAVLSLSCYTQPLNNRTFIVHDFF